MNNDIPIYEDTLPNILNKLRSEHNSKYVYRGQIRDWPMPLVPSLFRAVMTNKEGFVYKGSKRLRESGVVFVEENPPEHILLNNSPKNAITHMRQINIAKELRHTFGYPLTQVFAQQVGLGSEGLDVSRNINIAAYFATHDYINNEYVECDDGIGVIYRFLVEEPSVSFEFLNEHDFYTCPSYLPSTEILDLFDRCMDGEESINSVLEYRRKRVETIANDAVEARKNRPHKLIKFPAMSRYYSRIVQQSAGLLLPDMLLSDFWSSIEVPAPAEKIKHSKQPCVEDMRYRPGTSQYLFKHSSENHKHVPVSPSLVFAKEDIVCQILRLWLSRVLGSDVWEFRDSILYAINSDDDLIS
ncbi:MAG: FRG domain-containing protein [Planctomycetota bacterium]|jgi:hypothetical protein